MKDLGVLLVDIGANQTSYVVYEEGYPLFYGVLPIGGEHVTKDISIGLQVDIRDAEQIKKEQGSVMHQQQASEETDTIDKRFLTDIMTARYEEIFELVQEDLVKHQKDGRLPA
ncbi:MAG: cell division FtsA domain-containing protein [bacterium]|nr:cell division FtsA domain-containing protein [bacterium]